MRKLKNHELAAFASQLSIILKSGLSSTEGISLLMEDRQNEQEMRLLQAIYVEVLRSGDLAPALENAGQFPSYFVNMVRIGEETGSLDDVMQSIAEHYEREYAISQSLKNALSYPLVMIGMITAIIVLLLTKVLPIFEQVFMQLGTEMTGLARGFLNLGAFVKDYWYAVILVIVLFLALTYFVLNKKYHLKPDICASRFAGCMALALKSGMTADRGFEFAEELIDNKKFQKKLLAAKELFASGESLPASLKEAQIFSGTYARLLSIADKTGTTDEVMSEIADKFEDEIHERIHRLIAALEPTLVVILSLIVGMILFSVMFPLMSMMTGL